MPRLVVNSGSPSTWEIQLKPGTNLIGRGLASDFKVDDGSVSGSHCEITVENGRTTIRDLGSTNGTFVNRAQVTQAVLQDGQTIHLGRVEMVFHAESRAGVSPAHSSVVPISIPPKPTLAPMPPPLPAAGQSDTVRITAPAPPAALPAEPMGGRLAVKAPASGLRTVASAVAASVEESVNTAALAEQPRLSPDPGSASVSPALGPSTGILSTPTTAGGTPDLLSGGPCKHHPKTPGRFYCNQCRQYFCEICVSTRTGSGVSRKTCRHCGAECLPVQVSLQRSVEKSFFSRLPDAFGYPVRGAGAIIVIAGLLVMVGLRLGGFLLLYGTIRGSFRGIVCGLLLLMFAGGYLYAYLQNIIHSTANEDRELPDLPGVSNAVEDLLLPFGRLLVLGLVCFGPAIAMGIWVSPVAALAAALIGLVYFPMGFLSSAMLDSIVAANPMVVVPSIVKVVVEYIVAMAMLGIVVAFWFGGDRLLNHVFPLGFSTGSMGEMFALLGARAFWVATSFYLLIVAVHVLGLLYVSKKKQLGWLDH